MRRPVEATQGKVNTNRRLKASWIWSKRQNTAKPMSRSLITTLSAWPLISLSRRSPTTLLCTLSSLRWCAHEKYQGKNQSARLDSTGGLKYLEILKTVDQLENLSQGCFRRSKKTLRLTSSYYIVLLFLIHYQHCILLSNLLSCFY